MTRKLDLGAWIASASAIVIVGAVVAGFLAVGGPGDARALRLDAVKLGAMHDLATAARCAYTLTNNIPASAEEAWRAVEQHRDSGSPNVCNSLQQNGPLPSGISYEIDGRDYIRLCANFNRPTPPEGSNYWHASIVDIPEFNERRQVAGPHCYRIRMVKFDRSAGFDPEMGKP